MNLIVDQMIKLDQEEIDQPKVSEGPNYNEIIAIVDEFEKEEKRRDAEGKNLPKFEGGSEPDPKFSDLNPESSHSEETSEMNESSVEQYFEPKKVPDLNVAFCKSSNSSINFDSTPTTELKKDSSSIP